MRPEYIRDEQPSGSKMFNDASKQLWKDNLPFNIFTSEGYMTEDAKQFIRDNREAVEPFKKDNTWADAILDYAEFRELGYQVQKGAPKRSDVKFSGSMILKMHMEASDRGEVYDPTRGGYSDNSSAKDKYEDTRQENIESYR